MRIEREYNIYPTEDGRFILAIQAYKTIAEHPYIIYAGGKHAILYRNDKIEDAVVLDFLSEDARKLMSSNKHAIVVELENKNPVYDYIAKIEIRDKLPIQLTEKSNGNKG